MSRVRSVLRHDIRGKKRLTTQVTWPSTHVYQFALGRRVFCALPLYASSTTPTSGYQQNYLVNKGGRDLWCHETLYSWTLFLTRTVIPTNLTQSNLQMATAEDLLLFFILFMAAGTSKHQRLMLLTDSGATRTIMYQRKWNESKDLFILTSSS